MREFISFIEEISLPLLMLIIAVLIGVSLLAWPVCYVGTISKIQEFRAVQQTLEEARANKSISNLELAAIQHKVVDSNKWLASTQYWNAKFGIDLYYPDEVDSLVPMR